MSLKTLVGSGIQKKKSDPDPEYFIPDPQPCFFFHLIKLTTNIQECLQLLHIAGILYSSIPEFLQDWSSGYGLPKKRKTKRLISKWWQWIIILVFLG